MIISRDLFPSYRIFLQNFLSFFVKFIYCYDDNFKIDIYTGYSILIYRCEILVNYINCMKKKKGIKTIRIKIE